MTPLTSLLALVLVVLGGGVSPAWADVPADHAAESPAAPDAPAPDGPTDGEAEVEEAVFGPTADGRPGTVRRAPTADGSAAGVAEGSVGTPPPER